MNEMVMCQSCGMPLDSDEVKGTNADGSLSEEYCIHCYKDGAFTHNMSMDEMIETNLMFLDEWNKSSGLNLTVDEARAQLKEFLPTLKRWQ